MSSSKKLKIEVRPLTSHSVSITAREKQLFVCRNCRNHYYAFYHFCPQCLGRVYSLNAPPSALRILSIPEGHEARANEWIEMLGGKTERDLLKPLQHLPFILIDKSDEGALGEWKDALEVEEIQSEIVSTAATGKKKAKYSPLFSADAPAPYFLPPSVDNELRDAGRAMQNPAIRLRWAESVITGYQVIQMCYKDDPTLRVLFADFLYRIQKQFEESLESLQTSYRGRQEAFAPAIRKMAAEFRRMEKEIQTIRKTVRQQL